VSLGVESSKNGPFQGTMGVGRHADVCEGLIHMALALQWGSVASRGQDLLLLETACCCLSFGEWKTSN